MCVCARVDWTGERAWDDSDRLAAGDRGGGGEGGMRVQQWPRAILAVSQGCNWVPAVWDGRRVCVWSVSGVGEGELGG